MGKKEIDTRGKVKPAIIIILALLAGFMIGQSKLVKISFGQSRYAIGIYQGEGPLALKDHPAVRNPVIQAKNVTDVPAGFVADPFMVEEKGKWYMFFEVLNIASNKGEIGLAESDDALHWRYKQIILKENVHLSYPYVFKWENEFYMIPESVGIYEIRLYKAERFPYDWKLVKTLIKGNYFDSSIVRYQDKWWLFTSDRNDVLHLFSSDELTGKWVEHPKSPIVFQNPEAARGGGRLIVIEDKIYRFAQDCRQMYGHRVNAFEIKKISETDYQEIEVKGNPILKPDGRGWNGERMHHIDAHQVSDNKWVACVDGVGKYFDLAIKTR